MLSLRQFIYGAFLISLTAAMPGSMEEPITDHECPASACPGILKTNKVTQSIRVIFCKPADQNLRGDIYRYKDDSKGKDCKFTLVNEKEPITDHQCPETACPGGTLKAYRVTETSRDNSTSFMRIRCLQKRESSESGPFAMLAMLNRTMKVYDYMDDSKGKDCKFN